MYLNGLIYEKIDNILLSEIKSAGINDPDKKATGIKIIIDIVINADGETFFKIVDNVKPNNILVIINKIKFGINIAILFQWIIFSQPYFEPKIAPPQRIVHKNVNNINPIFSKIIVKINDLIFIWLAPILFNITLFLNSKIVWGITDIPTIDTATSAIEIVSLLNNELCSLPGICINAKPSKNNKHNGKAIKKNGTAIPFR
ncbi:hypothetical protein [Spiroplasma endosymbiont of Labia minor]|uniref:hypothetical protein n=1 Tax=Spiroplasma endosymbiont of Labia minor TaxID=3066305 RepID=UPI0030D06811